VPRPGYLQNFKPRSNPKSQKTSAVLQPCRDLTGVYDRLVASASVPGEQVLITEERTDLTLATRIVFLTEVTTVATTTTTDDSDTPNSARFLRIENLGFTNDKSSKLLDHVWVPWRGVLAIEKMVDSSRFDCSSGQAEGKGIRFSDPQGDAGTLSLQVEVSQLQQQELDDLRESLKNARFCDFLIPDVNCKPFSQLFGPSIP
jgi:hypothetical protein